MTDEQRGALLVQKETAENESRELKEQVKRHINNCKRTAAALEIVLSHGDLVVECLEEVDEGWLVDVPVVNDKLQWEHRRAFRPDDVLAGIAQTALKLRDNFNTLRKLTEDLKRD